MLRPRSCVLWEERDDTLLGAALNDRTARASETQTALRAQAIELVDDSGQVRAQLNATSGGEVVFRLRDARGTGDSALAQASALSPEPH